MDPQYTYDLTLIPASKQYKPWTILAAHDPVLIDGVLIYSVPDGKTCIRVLSMEPHIREVQQVQSATPPNAYQQAGTFRHKELEHFATRGANLDERADLKPAGLSFTIELHTMDPEIGVLTITGAQSVEFENGILRVREAQAGVYRHFNLVNGAIRQVEITPVEV